MCGGNDQSNHMTRCNHLTRSCMPPKKNKAEVRRRVRLDTEETDERVVALVCYGLGSVQR